MDWRFLLSLGCAASMGFAIQRGATCTVAAMDEIVRQRRGTRLSAMLIASMWVASLALIARAAGVTMDLPQGQALTLFTILGGVLLGVGAFVTGGCVFGAIARLGSGEWAFALVPPGFMAGAALVEWASWRAPTMPVLTPLLSAASLALAAAGAFVLLEVIRGAAGAARFRRDGDAVNGWRKAWSPRRATTAIGIAFFILLLNEGAWAYTDALADLAAGRPQPSGSRLALFGALLAGAWLGGWIGGRFRATRPDARSLLRCFSGGLLMGAGSVMIPGSNDGMILLGMPLLLPYAWAGFATMCLAIGAVMLAGRPRSTT